MEADVNKLHMYNATLLCLRVWKSKSWVCLFLWSIVCWFVEGVRGAGGGGGIFAGVFSCAHKTRRCVYPA